MTAPIDHRGNEYLKLAEELRQRRATKWGDPDHGQMVPLDLLDAAIVTIINLGHKAGSLTDADVGRFVEAWHE